jgi:predicted CXXCH cytochrome family protein
LRRLPQPDGKNSASGLLTKHTINDTCQTCHQQQRAEFNKRSHMPLPEGKMSCVDCHNPHGSVTKPLLKAESANAVCYSCHAENASLSCGSTRQCARTAPIATQCMVRIATSFWSRRGHIFASNATTCPSAIRVRFFVAIKRRHRDSCMVGELHLADASSFYLIRG